MTMTIGVLGSCGDDDSDEKSTGSGGSAAQESGGQAGVPGGFPSWGGTPEGGAGAESQGGAENPPPPDPPSNGGAEATGGSSDGFGGEPGLGGSPSDDGAGGSFSTDYTCPPACAPGSMCCPVGVHLECVPADEAGCGVPDLTINEAATTASVDIDFVNANADPCLLEEGCVSGPGMRRVLVFDTETPNIGSGDLIVGEPSPSNPDFVFSPCHGHYHFEGYATYDLVDAAGNVVASGHKQAYCMRDDSRFLSDSDVRGAPLYNCDGGVQGISRGWSDIYDVGLDCQWVDITGVPAGDYYLRTRINPERRIYELDYSNNELLVPVYIPN